MEKPKYLLKRIFSMDYKGFFRTISDIHLKTKRSRLLIFIDIIYCGLKYQAGYIDYELFEMYKMNKYQRKTVITRGINNEIIRKYNDPKAMKIFADKIKFNEVFNKYLKREWLEITKDNYDEFNNFCKKHYMFIAKPTKECCGKGVEIVNTNGKNLKKVHDMLYKTNHFLVEELVKQNRILNELHPDSINTIRVVTLRGIVVASLLRIGNNYNHVDNFNHEGLCVPIELESGKIVYEAIDKKGNLYKKHPLTNKDIQGLKIPKWKEVKKFCEKAALEIPEVGYIGWDVSITKDNDICFIEANEFPGHDLYGLPPHRKNNIGLLPKFKEAMEREE